MRERSDSGKSVEGQGGGTLQDRHSKVDLVFSYSTRGMGSEEGGEIFMKKLVAAMSTYGYTSFEGPYVHPEL